jgi:hypothetical protein
VAIFPLPVEFQPEMPADAMLKSVRNVLEEVTILYGLLMRIRNLQRTFPVILAFVVAILVPRDTFAYVDPNSAGILYQIFFPLVLAAVAAWRWIKGSTTWFWKRITRRTD